MPSLAFVKSCISRPRLFKRSKFFAFNFPLKVGENKSSFYVYKELEGIGTIKQHYLSLSPENQIIDISRKTNDDYYNFVLSAFGVPEGVEIECFLYRRWRPRFLNYSDNYYFNFDDFPNGNKGRSYVSTKTISLFKSKLFKDTSYAGNKYIDGTTDDFSLMTYTANHGSSPTCESFRLSSSYTYAYNRGCFFMPVGVSYLITNYEDPEDVASYERNFGDYHIIKHYVYYLKLGDVQFDSDCCLSECFGIVEQK